MQGQVYKPAVPPCFTGLLPYSSQNANTFLINNADATLRNTFDFHRFDRTLGGPFVELHFYPVPSYPGLSVSAFFGVISTSTVCLGIIKLISV